MNLDSRPVDSYFGQDGSSTCRQPLSPRDPRMSIDRSEVDAPGPGSAVLSDPTEDPGHSVQFYEDDEFLLDAVSRFMGAGLRAGDGGVVIATSRHLDGVAARLSAGGLDVAAARDRGQYVAVDAAELLSGFMERGWPEPARFAEVVGGLLAGAAGDGRPVRAFGEMVALLWAEGSR